MRACDIVGGDLYHLKGATAYKEVKAVQVLPPKTGVNTNDYIVVECLHSSMSARDEEVRYRHALTRYFRPRDLVRIPIRK